MRAISPIIRSKDQARHYYNRISKIYDLLTVGEKPLIQQGVDLMKIEPGEKILEIGCGTGTGLKYIQKNLSEEDTSVGIDLSHNMLLESQRKTGASSSGTYLVQGDAANIPTESYEFDGIFCAFTLELFPKSEIPLVLNEFRRVLKTRGRLVIVSLAQDPHTFAVSIYERLHEIFPVAVDCRPIPLVTLLIKNGYKIKTSETIKYWGLPVSTALCHPV